MKVAPTSLSEVIKHVLDNLVPTPRSQILITDGEAPAPKTGPPTPLAAVYVKIRPL